MNRRSPTIMRSALRLLSVRLVLGQIAIALAVFLLFALWLHVPDASGLDVAGSVLLALIVIAVAGAGESAWMLCLVGRGRTLGRLLRGTLLLSVAVALWFVWSSLMDRAALNDGLRAGYINSQLPHALRYYFTYIRIYDWLDWTWSILTWIGAGVLATLVFAGTASARPLEALLRAARSITFWLVMIVGTVAATWLTGKVMGWTPGHGLRREMLSLVLRLGFVVLADAIVVCLILAVIGACVKAGDTTDPVPQTTPEGTPPDSQPRTVENP